MSRARKYTEEQIIRFMTEVDAGKRPKDLCREIGVTETTFYRWKAKYGGMTVSDARKLRALEEENRKLKRLVADQALDILALKEINSKNW
jgi:putative transposase